MGVIWLALGALALWAIVRLGRNRERPGRGEWRIAATMLAAALLGGAVLAGARGAWMAAIAMAGAGLYLAISSRQRPPVERGEGLSLTEARSILGVTADADADAVNAAWRRLMARAHPDQGGTEGLAARLNAARDRLLKP